MTDKSKDLKGDMVALRLSDKERVILDAAGKLVTGGRSEVLRRGGIAEAVSVIQDAAARTPGGYALDRIADGPSW